MYAAIDGTMEMTSGVTNAAGRLYSVCALLNTPNSTAESWKPVVDEFRIDQANQTHAGRSDCNGNTDAQKPFQSVGTRHGCICGFLLLGIMIIAPLIQIHVDQHGKSTNSNTKGCPGACYFHGSPLTKKIASARPTMTLTNTSMTCPMVVGVIFLCP